MLKSERDTALRLLSDNKAQAREGIDLLVREKMADILRASRPPGTPPLSAAQTEVLYTEILTLAYNTFALGFTVSRLQKPAK